MFLQLLKALLRIGELQLQRLDLLVGGCDRVILRGLRENFVTDKTRESQRQHQQHRAHDFRRLSALRFRSGSKNLSIEFNPCHDASRIPRTISLTALTAKE